LIEAVRASARHAGIPEERVRSERFLAAPMASTDQPVDLLLQRSGKRVRVAPDQTVLEAVEAAGVAAPAVAALAASRCSVARPCTAMGP
jgi:hypothetical protein